MKNYAYDVICVKPTVIRQKVMKCRKQNIELSDHENRSLNVSSFRVSIRSAKTSIIQFTLEATNKSQTFPYIILDILPVLYSPGANSRAN